MARIKLSFPDRHIFCATFPVRIGDLNYGGHVGNDAVLSLIHEARMRFLAAHGLSEMDVFGAGIIMTDSVLTYHAELFYGDELTVDVAAGEAASMYFELYYRIAREGKKAVTAKTGFVCFDYAERKVRPVPDEFLSLLAGEGGQGAIASE